MTTATNRPTPPFTAAALAEEIVLELDDARQDYDSLAADAGRVLLAVERCDCAADLPDEVRVALDALRENGREGWWRDAAKAASVTRPPSTALRARVAELEAQVRRCGCAR